MDRCVTIRCWSIMPPTSANITSCFHRCCFRRFQYFLPQATFKLKHNKSQGCLVYAITCIVHAYFMYIILQTSSANAIILRFNFEIAIFAPSMSFLHRTSHIGDSGNHNRAINARKGVALETKATVYANKFRWDIKIVQW